jgi:uncharacterized membrane protein
MPRITESITIRRPRADVARYMDDVTREREWQPALLDASQEPAGPSAPGTRKRYVSEFLGRRIENTYVVIACDPGRRMTSETTPDSAMRGTTEIVWDDVGDATRVTLTIDGSPTGVLRFVPRRVLEDAYQRQLTATLQRLKDHLESGAAPE